MSDQDLRALATAWADADPDETTRAELLALLAVPDLATTDVADRFAMMLEFGTAGLRGVLGAGPNRMNRAVVLRTTWGFGRHLLAAVPDAAERGVVVGYDGRRRSRDFAEDTACVLAALGIRSWLFDTVGPTPLIAFAVTRKGAAAGVMVTASHNPPEYNGYKVYWDNGAQIVPPVDVDIAKAISKSPSAVDVPRLDLVVARERGLVLDLGDAMKRAYLDAILDLLRSPRPEGDRSIRTVYSAMHGVGDELLRRAFDEAKFDAIESVPEQSQPDGAFPTVAFPNPEEKGAMDLSFALARRTKAELVLANDPDADRLAVAVPDPASPTGYVQLTGNQVGVLLGHDLLERAVAGRSEADRGKLLVLASCVSSPMLGVIAGELGVRYEETLTGFKWIANRAMQLEASEGLEFVFGYEEALGYTVGTVVRDKDGIGAGLAFADFAARLKTRGRSVQAELESIARRFGLFVSTQVNVTKRGVAGAAEIRALMAGLRARSPKAFGPFAIRAVRDVQSGTRVDAKTGERSAIALPPSNVVIYDLEGGSRVIARPSGTEPKIKYYVDVREPVRDGEPFADAEVRATVNMKALSDAFVAFADAGVA
ncbi:MAG: phospho-sugar mutase [Polyangiaceae bacterium]